MDNTAVTTPSGRRKRPKVPDASRKRIATACLSCRKVKEKCDGGVPCTRCTRLNRCCQIESSSPSQGLSTPGSSGKRKDFFDHERIDTLEAMVRHLTGATDLSKKSLKEQLASIKVHGNNANSIPSMVTPSESTSSPSDHDDARNRKLQPSTLTHTGELSHCRFFESVQSKIDERSGVLRAQDAEPINAMVVSYRMARLKSGASIILNAVASLPPIEVSTFLVDMFFRFARTNYSYVDESTFRTKLTSIYSDLATLDIEGAPALCMILMVLTLGTQFAHLSSNSEKQDVLGPNSIFPEDMISPDDNVTLALYHAATSLLPDVLAAATVESVQSLLLLGVYTLPIDSAGLSYTYLGMAVRLAMQNDMHMQAPASVGPVVKELRNRIWWTAYSLEKRIAILHGMPVAVQQSDVTTSLPGNIPELHTDDDACNIPNFTALIQLTDILGNAGATILSLRHASKESRVSAVTSLSRATEELVAYWQSLPEKVICKDLDPAGPLFRSNVHLTLTYHMYRMFIGRNFIFDATDDENPNHPIQPVYKNWVGTRRTLVSRCVESAVSIVELCQLLKEHVGLARGSYTEFSSCRGALLVILASRIQEDSISLQTASETGLDLLKYMSVGIYSAAVEKAAIQAMEVAVGRLNRIPVQNPAATKTTLNSAYNNFRNWAKLWSQDRSEQPHASPSDAQSTFLHLANSTQGLDTHDNSNADPSSYDLDPIMASFPFQFDDFTSVPDFQTDFNFRLDAINT